uniref:NADP-dependent oxidoreductase domain-containing protein n=1 Tax=Gopherus agassizii TaxID=38772 RepID=A0A452IAW5_9SAUR
MLMLFDFLFLIRSFQKSKCEEAVKVAIEVGHRHIDGAYFYENEKEFWSTFNTPEMVLSALEKSLKSQQFDYIDLYIIHTPLSLKVKRNSV